jgi:hypothetical protein
MNDIVKKYFKEEMIKNAGVGDAIKKPFKYMKGAGKLGFKSLEPMFIFSPMMGVGKSISKPLNVMK